ncbi:MAG: hypothetical protein RQ885_09125 [Desulfurococcales archaeon]|nr:hypothetical protein [Desulfurococcales archaeon]
MKLYTHIIGGFSLASLANLLVGPNPWILSYIFILLFLVNLMIDIGHSRHVDGRILRSPYTHEVLSCMALSAITGYILWLAIGNVYEAPLDLSIYASLLIAASHLAGDIVTRGGIYIYIGRTLYRVSISNLSYRDPILNTLFIVVQLAPLILNIFIIHSNPTGTLTHNLLDKALAMYSQFYK